MAKRLKKPKKQKGGKRSGGFVRDSIGRFARTAGEALGKAAKAAMEEATEELSQVAKENARRAVREAEDEFKHRAREWKAARKSSDIDSEEFAQIEKNYKAAIKARAKARVDFFGKE